MTYFSDTIRKRQLTNRALKVALIETKITFKKTFNKKELNKKGKQENMKN